ncbi:MAG: hypothetical protein JSS63_09910 [Bacteroidetes bacterium]|nr:hypothetical protein [Bacteroidota bacterium]
MKTTILKLILISLFLLISTKSYSQNKLEDYYKEIPYSQMEQDSNRYEYIVGLKIQGSTIMKVYLDKETITKKSETEINCWVKYTYSPVVNFSNTIHGIATVYKNYDFDRTRLFKCLHASLITNRGTKYESYYLIDRKILDEGDSYNVVIPNSLIEIIYFKLFNE